jgi:hypothetical protein
MFIISAVLLSMIITPYTAIPTLRPTQTPYPTHTPYPTSTPYPVPDEWLTTTFTPNPPTGVTYVPNLKQASIK